MRWLARFGLVERPETVEDRVLARMRIERQRREMDALNLRVEVIRQSLGEFEPDGESSADD